MLGLRPEQRRCILKQQGGKCFFCGKKLGVGNSSIEHLIAKAHGGPHEDGNLVVCCVEINQRLGSKLVAEKLKEVLSIFHSGKFQYGQCLCQPGLRP